MYEKISDNVKMLWHEGFDLKDNKYTQVSAYIFNDLNQLLIVNNGSWTIPGGHPEAGEIKEETLHREVMEETCVTIKDLKYLGSVEVVEDNKIYYQARYVARVLKVLEYDTEWETTERAFVNLEDLNKYITWSNGKTFASQIESAKKMLNINK